MVKSYLSSIRTYLSNNSKTLFITVICLFAILRIYIGANIPIWFYINSPNDDLLMLAYSNIPQYLNQWNILTLTKTISYPIFLFFVNLTGISYKLWLALLSLISAFLAVYAVNKYITKNKIVLIFIFLFLSFLPINFDITTTARVYRNAILMPCTLIYLTTLFIFINNAISKESNLKKLMFWTIIVGLTFTFTFYIKEDGIILFPILIVSIIAIILFKVYKFIQKHGKLNKITTMKLTKITIICIIPLLIFSASTIGLKEVNNHYFGVSEINTRTDGEVGLFYKNLLKIEDSNKTTEVWVPASTIEKAWNASPTLQSRPDLLNAILHSEWAGGDYNKTPIKGDHISWALRYNLNDTGLFNNEKTANDFLFKVNNELNSAFKNGTLEKSDKIFITESATGKSLDEIKKLIPYIIAGFKINLFYDNIASKDLALNNAETTYKYTNDKTESAEIILNDNLIMMNNNPDTIAFKEKIPMQIIDTIISLYQLISYVFVALSIIGFIGLGTCQIKNKFRNRKLNTLLGFQIMLLGTFLLQIIGISWFSSWIVNGIVGVMKFYTASSQGVFALFEVLAICSLYYLLSKKKILKRN